MKIRHCFLGLVLCTATLTCYPMLGFAQSVKADSKFSDCHQFEAALGRFNENLTDPSNDRDSQKELLEQLLTVFNTEIEQFKRQAFTDATVQSLHQQALENIVSARQASVDYLNALEAENTQQAQVAYGNMQLLPYQLDEVIQQFEQYCLLSPSAIAPDTSPEIRSALERFVRPGSEEQRQQAIDELVRLGPSAIRPLFLLRRDSRYWGTYLLDGMYEVSRRIGEPAIPQLVSIFQEPDPTYQLYQVSFFVTEALVQFGDLAIPQLVPLLNNPDERVRSAATEVLQKLGYKPENKPENKPKNE